MIESLILGMVQGVAEWLPVSSEAMIILVKSHFFADGQGFSDMISFAVFLHTGTLLAALVYYRKKVALLCKDVFRYKYISQERKQILRFICYTTLVSGILGVILLQVVEHYEHLFTDTYTINLFVGSFLLITALLLNRSEQQKEHVSHAPLTRKRAIITGIFQGFAAIPGISRSGSTIAGMGLLGIPKEKALELSFILSIPLVFLANIILNARLFLNLNIQSLTALGSAFVFGIITIELLLRLVKRIRFSYFVAGFAFILFLVTFLFLLL